MKKLFPVLLLVISIPSFGQTMAEKISSLKNTEKFTTSYNKFDDFTIVRSGDIRLSPKTGGMKQFESLSLDLGFGFRGKSLSKSAETFTITVFSICVERWCFIEDHSLIFLIDGVRYDLGNGNRKGNVVKTQTSFLTTEQTVYFIKPSLIETASKSKVIEYRAGRYEGSFDDAFRDVMQSIFTLSNK